MYSLFLGITKKRSVNTFLTLDPFRVFVCVCKALLSRQSTTSFLSTGLSHEPFVPCKACPLMLRKERRRT